MGGAYSSLARPEVEEGDWYLSVAVELIYITSWNQGLGMQVSFRWGKGSNSPAGAWQAPPLGCKDPPLYSPDKFLVSTKFLSALSHSSTATTPGVGKPSVGFLP